MTNTFTDTIETLSEFQKAKQKARLNRRATLGLDEAKLAVFAKAVFATDPDLNLAIETVERTQQKLHKLITSIGSNPPTLEQVKKIQQYYEKLAVSNKKIAKGLIKDNSSRKAKRMFIRWSKRAVYYAQQSKRWRSEKLVDLGAAEYMDDNAPQPETYLQRQVLSLLGYQAQVVALKERIAQIKASEEKNSVELLGLHQQLSKVYNKVSNIYQFTFYTSDIYTHYVDKAGNVLLQAANHETGQKEKSNKDDSLTEQVIAQKSKSVKTFYQSNKGRKHFLKQDIMNLKQEAKQAEKELPNAKQPLSKQIQAHHVLADIYYRLSKRYQQLNNDKYAQYFENQCCKHLDTTALLETKLLEQLRQNNQYVGTFEDDVNVDAKVTAAVNKYHAKMFGDTSPASYQPMLTILPSEMYMKVLTPSAVRVKRALKQMHRSHRGRFNPIRFMRGINTILREVYRGGAEQCEENLAELLRNKQLRDSFISAYNKATRANGGAQKFYNTVYTRFINYDVGDGSESEMLNYKQLETLNTMMEQFFLLSDSCPDPIKERLSALPKSVDLTTIKKTSFFGKPVEYKESKRYGIAADQALALIQKNELSAEVVSLATDEVEIQTLSS